MSRGLAVLLGAGAGCLVGMQAPINSRLGKVVGSVQAATFSFIVGTVALVLIASFVRGGLGDFLGGLLFEGDHVGVGTEEARHFAGQFSIERLIDGGEHAASEQASD